MVAAVAFCPHPPLLVPEVARGAAAELDPARAACRAALTRIAAPGRPWVLFGSAGATHRHSPHAVGTLAGYGVAFDVRLGATEATAPPELPLSLTIGAWLLAEYVGDVPVTAWSIGPDEPVVAELPADAALLVVGDGSARRSIAAPGYLDPRAEAHDAAVADALAAGDPDALAAIDPTGLLVAGTPAWRAAAAAAPGPWTAELHYDAAPYGVGYVVATWTR